MEREPWYQNPHCNRAGKLHEECGFCGATNERCAETCTEWVRDHHELACGGAGFWCSACGKFYAQDSCGETEWEETLQVKEGFTYCACGQKLYKSQFVEDHD